MAWSYTANLANTGFVDGSELQLYWKNTWTVSEIPCVNVGYIRLSVTCRTSDFWVYRKGYEWNTGYDYYDTSSISCGKDTLYFRQNVLVNNGAYNFTKELDVPNSWAGETVTLNIARRKVSVTLGASKTFQLSTNAGNGSSIIVNRNSSNVGSVASLSNGAIIYDNDGLIIYAVPDTNYIVTSLVVNGDQFTSGDTLITTGDVSVYSIAQILASDVGATDADIEATSTITIARYDSSYVHTLEYSFGSLSGYITASGGTSDTKQIITEASVPFVVPSSFYSQIPNAQSGVCTITCKTYANTDTVNMLGNATTCTFTAKVSPTASSPIVSGTVIDTNEDTIALTGDASKIVRYKSVANCTITVVARNSATIAEKSINGVTVQDGDDSIILRGDDLTQQSIRFSATDSRGFTTSVDVPITLIPYVKLTCNPVISRNTPTDGNIVLSLSGKAYTGDSGWTNQLSIKYRYKVSGDTIYSSWETIPNYVMSNSAYSVAPFMLARPEGQDGFNYRDAYEFEIKVEDGDGSHVCSIVTKTIVAQQGIPVFDWGKTDFRFNVPIKIGNTELTEEQLISLLALLQ